MTRTDWISVVDADGIEFHLNLTEISAISFERGGTGKVTLKCGDKVHLGSDICTEIRDRLGIDPPQPPRPTPQSQSGAVDAMPFLAGKQYMEFRFPCGLILSQLCTEEESQGFVTGPNLIEQLADLIKHQTRVKWSTTPTTDAIAFHVRASQED